MAILVMWNAYEYDGFPCSSGMLVDDQVEVYLCMNLPVIVCLCLVCFMHFFSVYALCSFPALCL